MRRHVLTKWILIGLIASMPGVGAAVADDSSKTAWIGVKLNGLSSKDGGVAVSRIFEDSPAARAGLRASDAIVAVNGTRVSGVRDLIRQIQQRETGSWIPLTVNFRRVSMPDASRCVL